jgi:hypothetical protein
MAGIAKTWTGASGNVVIYNAGPHTLTGLNYSNTTAGTVVTIFDSPTTNAGTILWQGTLAATTADTIIFPAPLQALTGVTINATAAVGAAGAVYSQ